MGSIKSTTGIERHGGALNKRSHQDHHILHGTCNGLHLQLSMAQARPVGARKGARRYAAWVGSVDQQEAHLPHCGTRDDLQPDLMASRYRHGTTTISSGLSPSTMHRQLALKSTALGAWRRVGYLNVERILAVCRVSRLVRVIRDTADIKRHDGRHRNAHLRAHARSC